MNNILEILSQYLSQPQSQAILLSDIAMNNIRLINNMNSNMNKSTSPVGSGNGGNASNNNTSHLSNMNNNNDIHNNNITMSGSGGGGHLDYASALKTNTTNTNNNTNTMPTTTAGGGGGGAWSGSSDDNTNTLGGGLGNSLGGMSGTLGGLPGMQSIQGQGGSMAQGSSNYPPSPRLIDLPYEIISQLTPSKLNEITVQSNTKIQYKGIKNNTNNNIHILEVIGLSNEHIDRAIQLLYNTTNTTGAQVNQPLAS